MHRLFLFLAFAGVLAFVASAQVGNIGGYGQQAVTASAVALALPSTLASVCVKALPGNSSPAVVYIGTNSSVTTSTGYPLSPSDSVCYPIRNGAQIFLIASGTGSAVAWLGTYQ